MKRSNLCFTYLSISSYHIVFLLFYTNEFTRESYKRRRNTVYTTIKNLLPTSFNPFKCSLYKVHTNSVVQSLLVVVSSCPSFSI